MASHKFFVNEFQILKNFKRLYASSEAKISKANLVGRDILSECDITENELKSLIWTTKELKSSRSDHLLRKRHVSLVFTKPSARMQISFERAVHDLGGSSTTYSIPDWSDQPDISDSGRLLSNLSDVIVVAGLGQENLVKLADGATVPVINAFSDISCSVKALADVFTLQEAIGPLRRRCLSWVGPPTSLCNSYLTLVPKLEMNMRLCTICPKGTGFMSALRLPEGIRLCGNKAEVHECLSAAEAVYRADVVVSSQHNVQDYQINWKMMEEAALEWYFLHSLPRTSIEVTDDVFQHKNNLTWKSVANTRYVAQALIMRTLCTYKFSSQMPDFDGPP